MTTKSAKAKSNTVGIQTAERNLAGIGGYLRVSRVQFPPECRTPTERAAYLESLRFIRRAELEADAARNGEVITAWYDDIGVSGRGEFYPKRTDFARARRDAKAGKLSGFYARDLSRLFRNVVQQELWFAEMEELGVVVHAQDLPFASDDATRRLLRQQMGILHEYVASRMGTAMRERIRTRVLNDLGTVTHASCWGLTYNGARKAYDFDPETADRVRLVFETLRECQGVAGHAARQLNRMLALGHPRATATPSGRTWKGALVLSLVRSARYRRAIQFGDLIVPAPSRIPEVVPADLVAQVDALLAARFPKHIAMAAKRKKTTGRFTYLEFLRCGYCGAPFLPRPHRYDLPEGEATWVAYQCKATIHASGCSAPFNLQQHRIESLVQRGLEKAFALYLGSLPPTPSNHSPGNSPLTNPSAEARAFTQASAGGANENGECVTRPAWEEAMAAEQTRLDRKRDRYLELFASGLITDQAELTRYLERVSSERAFLQRPFLPSRHAEAKNEEMKNEKMKDEEAENIRRQSTDPGSAATQVSSPSSSSPSLSHPRGLADVSEVEACLRQFEEAWRTAAPEEIGSPEDSNQDSNQDSQSAPRREPVLDFQKVALMRRLRVTIIVRVLPWSGEGVTPFPSDPANSHSKDTVRGKETDQEKETDREKESGKLKRRYALGGRLTLALELPTLGLIGAQALHLAETEEDVAAYRRWRSACITDPRHSRPRRGPHPPHEV